jgi:ABC transporter with metal-binding/Fe-S-binding domain ATP-binding protein
MRVVVLFSGGKDSTYAAQWAIQQGFEVVLLTVKPEPYSMMFHHPNVKWTKLQAQALGVELETVEVTEKNWEEKLYEKIKTMNVSGIVTGAIASSYQKNRIEAIGKRLGIPVYSPLWHADEKKLEEMLSTMEIYVTAVSAEGLGKEFLGKPLRKLVDAKIKNIHPFLEGGEGETFVTDAPFFKKRIEIQKWSISWDGVRGIAEIEYAKLVPKASFSNRRF